METTELRVPSIPSSIGFAPSPRRGRGHYWYLAATFLLALAGCAAPTNGNPPLHVTATLTTVATPTPFSLTTTCPQPSQPAIQPGASLTLQPTSGPVGTQITVTASGLLPGCHLWLGLTVAPCTCETGGVVARAPSKTSGALQWISVDEVGTARATVCLCGVLYSYSLGYPPYPDVTPPARAGGNVQAYGPRAGDHFYLTIAGATISDPPPLYGLFSVTN